MTTKTVSPYQASVQIVFSADVEEKQALLVEASLARHTWWVTLLAHRMNFYFLVVDDDADHDVVVVM